MQFCISLTQVVFKLSKKQTVWELKEIWLFLVFHLRCFMNMGPGIKLGGSRQILGTLTYNCSLEQWRIQDLTLGREWKGGIIESVNCWSISHFWALLAIYLLQFCLKWITSEKLRKLSVLRIKNHRFAVVSVEPVILRKEWRTFTRKRTFKDK